LSLESDASDDARRRNGRWRWWVAGALVAAALAPFVIGLIRSSKLNEAEESLVGTWRTIDVAAGDGEAFELVIRRDRSMVLRFFEPNESPFEFPGTWRADAQVLFVRTEPLFGPRPWVDRIRTFLNSGILVGAGDTSEVRYERTGRDSVRCLADGQWYVAVRVPEPTLD
jgi:hypothetical protein